MRVRKRTNTSAVLLRSKRKKGNWSVQIGLCCRNLSMQMGIIVGYALSIATETAKSKYYQGKKKCVFVCMQT